LPIYILAQRGALINSSGIGRPPQGCRDGPDSGRRSVLYRPDDTARLQLRRAQNCSKQQVAWPDLRARPPQNLELARFGTLGAWRCATSVAEWWSGFGRLEKWRTAH